MDDVRVSFGDLRQVDDVVNAIGLCLDQTPDRDRWSFCSHLWYRTLFERVWLYSAGDEAEFTVTVIG